MKISCLCLQKNRRESKGFKEKLAKLIDVESIITLSITGAFIFLTEPITYHLGFLCRFFSLIVGFYFGTQAEKREHIKKYE